MDKESNRRANGADLLMACMFIFAIVTSALVGLDYGRQQLARQIAEKTHRIESTTNDFGTVEWRIVEINQHPGDGEGDKK